MRNICLKLAYDGTDLYGWQRQPARPTVQGLLESAVGTILGEKLAVWGSGRTDAGVHAANQVANFKTSCPIPCPNLVKALNDLLPCSVRIKEASDVPLSFHARYGAVSKTYRYRILLAPIASPFIVRFVYHYPYPLDRGRMTEAARFFLGKHDFTSFAAAEVRSEASTDHAAKERSRDRDRVRTLFSSRFLWRAKTSILIYEVRGNGFLHHMVRNVVGTLIEVGRNKLKPADIPEILKARDRSQAGPTAPAQGLCLWKVQY